MRFVTIRGADRTIRFDVERMTLAEIVHNKPTLPDGEVVYEDWDVHIRMPEGDVCWLSFTNEGDARDLFDWLDLVVYDSDEDLNFFDLPGVTADAP